MPASNMKVVTMAAAAERLGWDYTFTTKVVATGPVDRGVLKGDIVVIGSGDPSLGGRPTDGPAVVEQWADQIRARGVTRVEGRIIGNDNVFDDEGLGQGWAWDYLAYGYAAPIGGLDFNENVVRLSFAPGAAPGDPVAVSAKPDGSGLAIEAAVATAAQGGDADINVTRQTGSRHLGVRGSVPAGKTDVTQAVSVENPPEFTVGAIKLSSWVERLHERPPDIRPRSGSAALYNVQVFHIVPGRYVKVLSAFPRTTRLVIPRGRLKPGQRYAWRVWPYLGRTRGYTRAPMGVSWFTTRPR